MAISTRSNVRALIDDFVITEHITLQMGTLSTVCSNFDMNAGLVDTGLCKHSIALF